jgi:hypothetical protein
MTLSSLLIYVVFMDPYQGNSDVMSFSSYNKGLCGAHRNGENMKEHTCNTYIVKSNLGSKKKS